MTEDDLKAIEERANAATEGPWIWPCGDDGMHSQAAWEAYRRSIDAEDADDVYLDAIITTDGGYYGPKGPDKEFIAHARQDVPALVAEVRRLRQDLGRADARWRDWESAHQALAERLAYLEQETSGRE